MFLLSFQCLIRCRAFHSFKGQSRPMAISFKLTKFINGYLTSAHIADFQNFFLMGIGTMILIVLTFSCT